MVTKFLGSSAQLQRCGLSALSAMVIMLALGDAPLAQKGSLPWFSEPVCQSLTPSAVGGPTPKATNLMVLRYLSSSNYELAFRDSIILFDTYYQTMPDRARALGFSRDDVKRATAIYIGHGHADHMGDGPFVAQRTGARLIGAPLTVQQAIKMGLPESRAISVKGGEVQKYNGFTIESVLAHHSDRAPESARAMTEAWQALQKAAGTGRSADEERRHREYFNQNGTNDPRVADQGTIAFLVTFDSGFRLLFLDSSGPITEPERTMMQRIGGRVDVAIVAYQGFFVSQPQIEATLPLVRLFKPDVFLPTHHDETWGSYPDMAMYPLFMAIRDQFPKTRSISPLYRTPICFNLQTKDVYIGDSSGWVTTKARSSSD